VNNDLSRAFSVLNKCLFHNKLSNVRFILNPSEKYILHLRLPDVVEIGGGLASASITEILDNLVHVMIHLENHRVGVVDYTHNQYHRHEFGDKALQFGMIVVWHKTRGWGITHSDPNHPEVLSASKIRSPSEESVEVLKAVYKQMASFYAGLNKIRTDMKLNLRHKPMKVFQLKYICACKPPVIVRSGRRPDGPNPLDASCNVCGTKFVIEDQQID